MIEHSHRHQFPVSIRPFSRRTALRRAGQGAIAASLAVWLGPDPASAAQNGPPPPEWFDPNATRGGHGQVIIGNGPVYISHLPVFMFDTPAEHPHHFQVITEVAFSAESGDPQRTYVEDREATGAPLYTFSPNVAFRMLDLIAPSGGEPALSSFTGAIVRGHFERPRAAQPFGIVKDVVADDVRVDIQRVIYSHEFAFDPAPLDALEYVLFGQGTDLFLAHRITMAPDFDQILPVQIDGHAFGGEDLRQGIIIAIPERTDTHMDRLREGDRAIGEARHAVSGTAIATAIEIAAGSEMFFEEGELRFPHSDFAVTDAESTAGFGS